MTKDDLIFLLNTAATVSAHQSSGQVALDGARGIIKAYIKDKEELQDQAVLMVYDNLLQVSAAAEVPGVFTPGSFDLTDYVDPQTETTTEPETLEPTSTTPDDAPVTEPSPEQLQTPAPTEDPKE
jgi:hypothetical protein